MDYANTESVPYRGSTVCPGPLYTIPVYPTYADELVQRVLPPMLTTTNLMRTSTWFLCLSRGSCEVILGKGVDVMLRLLHGTKDS